MDKPETSSIDTIARNCIAVRLRLLNRVVTNFYDDALRPLGLKLADPARAPYRAKSVIYDYSGGKHPLTARWLAHYFGASVVQVPPGTAAPTPSPPDAGFSVVLGRDYALRWIGQA